MARVSEDLLAAAQAREASLYAVAWLATGDPVLARRITVEVLAEVLRSRRSEDVQPRKLTRQLLADHLDRHHSLDRQDRNVGDEPGSVPRWAELSEDDVLAATRRGLAAVPARDRLALALTELDDCPVTEAVLMSGSDVARRNAQDVLTAALGRVEEELAAVDWAPTAGEAIRRLAETAYPDPSPTTEALALIGAQRRRSRWLTLAGATAVLALALTIVLAQRPTTLQVAPTPSPTGSAPLDKAPMVDGVRLMTGATPSEADVLPRLPEAESDGLDPVLIPPTGVIPELTPETARDATLTAVFIERGADGEGRVILHLPGASSPYLVVPGVTLGPRLPGVKTVGPRTVDGDGHRAAVIEGHAVVVVDVRDASVKRFSVVQNEQATVGWLGRTDEVIVESDVGNTRLDVATGAVQPAATPASPDRLRLTSAGGLNQLQVFDGRGVLSSQHEQPAVVSAFVVPTATSASGWSAAAALFAPNPMSSQMSMGVYAVSPRLSGPVALMMPGIDHPYAVGSQVVGWASHDRVLFVAGVRKEPVLLAWDVHTGEQFLVSHLPVLSDSDTGWLGEWALWTPSEA